MARETGSASAFGALRESRGLIGDQIVLVAALLPKALFDVQALGRMVEGVGELARLVECVAATEESTVFPCLERWLNNLSNAVSSARLQRTKLQRASVALLLSSKQLLLRGRPEQAGRLQYDVAAVTLAFREWARVEELGLFAKSEKRLGPFVSRILGRAVLLSLASPPAGR